MSTTCTQLAFGTVQFGLNYGVARRSKPILETTVRVVLARAREFDILVLVPVPGYAHIEQSPFRLLNYLLFSVVLKITFIPQELGVKCNCRFCE